MGNDRNRVCPVELARSLDNRVRAWLQNPATILAPYVHEGMTVLDIGCGPGFFTVEMAKRVGPRGTVVAADLQQPMLDLLAKKVAGTDLDRRIVRVRCDRDRLNVSGTFDFVLLFFMVHEVPDQPAFFRQVRAVLRDGGQCLLVEPKLFHVSRTAFARTTSVAATSGFSVSDGPRRRFCWSAVLRPA